MNKVLFGALGALAIALTAGSASAANLVTNGGFETGDLTGWTFNPASSDPWGVTSSAPTDGSYAASTGCVGAQCTDQTNLSTASYLYQNISTVAGERYTLTFDFTPDAGTPNELKTLFGGAVVSDLINAANTGSLVTYTISNLVATGSSTQLEFLGRQDPGFDRLDNVVLTDNGATSVSAAPEPGAWALMLGGVGAMGLMLRRRRAVEVAA